MYGNQIQEGLKFLLFAPETVKFDVKTFIVSFCGIKHKLLPKRLPKIIYWDRYSNSIYYAYFFTVIDMYSVWPKNRAIFDNFGAQNGRIR